MAITALPTPPSRQRPAEFSDEADAFLGALPTFGAEANALQADVNTKQTTASAAATTATDKALEAANSATASSDSSVLSSDWATKLVDTVDGVEYSSKEYASGSTVLSGSAKEWAISSSSPNGTTDQSSKTYALEAATSAGEASVSAGDAETSAIQASKLNLGSKSSEPALDNQGQPLLVGATYYDTTLNKWRVYGTTGWEDGISSVAGVESLNGLTGVLSGFVTETGNQSLNDKTLVNPLILLAGTNGTVGQVPVSQGAGLPVIWGSGSEIIRVARTSNTVISAANKGNLIDITSGTFTQTFSAASTLGNGWFCYIRNSGTGDITVQGSETNVDVKGDFTTDTGWSKGSGWSITGGAAVATGAAGQLAANPAPLTAGKSYRITFTVTATVGDIRLFVGAVTELTISPISTSGTYSFDVANVAGTGLFFSPNNAFTGSIDNVSVKELATTIDGLTSYIMYPGECRLVQCDGAALRTVVLNSFYKVFTASGNFIKPPGYSLFDGLLWSAGGSGRVGAASTLRIGGGGGACCSFSLRYSDIGTTQVVTIGSGGLAVSAASTNGNAGGNSEFSGITAFGGKGGSNSESASTGNGGTAFYGFLTGSSNQSTASASSATSSIYGGGNGGDKTVTSGAGQTVYGGGGGMQITTSNTISDPGSTVFGGAGGATNVAGTAATAGSAPGGGGGAATNGSSSGPGARGELRIWGVI